MQIADEGRSEGQPADRAPFLCADGARHGVPLVEKQDRKDILGKLKAHLMDSIDSSGPEDELNGGVLNLNTRTIRDVKRKILQPNGEAPSLHRTSLPGGCPVSFAGSDSFAEKPTVNQKVKGNAGDRSDTTESHDVLFE